MPGITLQHLYAFGFLFTSLNALVLLVFGKYVDRQNTNKYLLEEVKSLKVEAQEEAKLQKHRADAAEMREKDLNTRIEKMGEKIEELEEKISTLSGQVRDHNELEERCATLEIDKADLEQSVQDLEERLIKSTLALEKALDDVEKYKELYRQATKNRDDNGDMDSSGVPIG